MIITINLPNAEVLRTNREQRQIEREIAEAEANAAREAYQPIKEGIILQVLANKIEKALNEINVNDPPYFIRIEFCEDDFDESEYNIFNSEVEKIVNEIINNALSRNGYNIDTFHLYSKGWRTRTGKIGYFYISY